MTSRKDEVSSRLLESALQTAESAASLISTDAEQEASRRLAASSVVELLGEARQVWNETFNPTVEKSQTPTAFPAVDPSPTATRRQSQGSKVKAQRPRQTSASLRGPRTQEYDFYLPILEALVRLGGEAPAREVLNIIEQEMADQFTEEDLLPIPSSPTYPRWDKTANWARQELAEQGYIVRPSRHGIWEISESGRGWLDEQLGRSSSATVGDIG